MSVEMKIFGATTGEWMHELETLAKAMLPSLTKPQSFEEISLDELKDIVDRRFAREGFSVEFAPLDAMADEIHQAQQDELREAFQASEEPLTAAQAEEVPQPKRRRRGTKPRLEQEAAVEALKGNGSEPPMPHSPPAEDDKKFVLETLTGLFADDALKAKVKNFSAKMSALNDGSLLPDIDVEKFREIRVLLTREFSA